jgi:hypothetical protein
MGLQKIIDRVTESNMQRSSSNALKPIAPNPVTGPKEGSPDKSRGKRQS